MAAHPASVNFEPAIWGRLIETPKEPISPEAARYLLSINFGESDHSRMEELMDKSNEGALTADEDAELGSYVNIANVLSVMHSRARRARVALRHTGFDGSMTLAFCEPKPDPQRLGAREAALRVLPHA